MPLPSGITILSDEISAELNHGVIMKQLIKFLRRIETTYYFYTRYMIAVRWRNVSQIKFFKTYDETLVWAAQYPRDAKVAIGKRGRLLATRWQ